MSFTSSFRSYERVGHSGRRRTAAAPDPSEGQPSVADVPAAAGGASAVAASTVVVEGAVGPGDALAAEGAWL
jgi:hypothetical protein